MSNFQECKALQHKPQEKGYIYRLVFYLMKETNQNLHLNLGHISVYDSSRVIKVNKSLNEEEMFNISRLQRSFKPGLIPVKEKRKHV